VKTVPPVAESDARAQSSSLQQEQGAVVARSTGNEQGASLQVHQPAPPSSQQQQQPPLPPRQQRFGGSIVEGESVEQCTGELELSPHKKAVFVLDANAAPVDVTSLTPMHGSGEASRASTTHEDSRVEPETGEVESMSVATSQVPSQPSVGTGSSSVQADSEATPTISEETQSRKEDQPESDEDEKDDSSDSSDDEDREGGSKRAGGVTVGKCYMDREGEEEEMGVASDKEPETKEDER
jgi:hypothetical protein